MIEKRQIEELLRVNGVHTKAPTDEIKSVLISARWNKNDVETALLVLREDSKSHVTKVDTLHKVFTSDEKLPPELISSLLGVDIDLSYLNVTSKSHRAGRYVSFGQMVQICILSVTLSSLCIFGSMWYLDLGVFHFTMR